MLFVLIWGFVLISPLQRKNLEMSANNMNLNSVSHPLNRAARTFVHESFRIFQSVPKQEPKFDIQDNFRLELLQYSEQFRSQLRSLATSVSKYAEELDLPDNVQRSKDELVGLDKLFDTMIGVEKSWQLCEIFFLNPTDLLSIEVIRWMKVLELLSHFVDI